MSPFLFLASVFWLAGSEEEICSVEPNEIDFCAQNRMMRINTLFSDKYPSYCFYGQENDYVAGVDFNVHNCGWEGMTQTACISAGCCYRDNMCFAPLRPEKTEFFFEKTWLNYNKSKERCLKDGKDLFCPRHEQDLVYMSENFCGISWLNGSPIEDDVDVTHVHNFLPFYDKETGCYQKRLSCHSESSEHLSIVKSNVSYRMEIRPETDKRHLLCVREQWVHFIDTYPQHLRYNGTDDKAEHVNTNHSGGEPRDKRFYCGIEFVPESKISIDWLVTKKDGTIHNITKTSGKYMHWIEATVVGNYTCTITLIEPPFLQHDHFSWLKPGFLQLTAFAYYYQDITLWVNVTVKSPDISRQVTRQLNSDGPNIFEALLGDEITILIRYRGFPYPESSITSRRIYKVAHNEDMEDKEEFVRMRKGRHDEDEWRIGMFAKEISLFESHYKENFSVIFSSQVHEEEQATQTFVVSKVFIKWALDDPPPDPDVIHIFNVSDQMRYQCFGHGVASLYEAEISWTLNDKLFNPFLPLVFELQDRGYLTITIRSARYAGVYMCMIDNGAATLSYNFTVKVRAPPVKPRQPYIKQVKLVQQQELVVAFPRSDDLWDNLIYTVTLFENNKTVNTTTIVSPEGKEIVATFPIHLDTSYTIRYNVTNIWGTSENSDFAYSILTFADIPSRPVDINLNSTKASTTSLTFGYKVSKDFSSYEGYLLNEETTGTSEYDLEKGTKLVSNSGKMTFGELKQNTHYVFILRGVIISSNGTKIYGPASPRYIIRTQISREVVYTPSGFRGQQVESYGRYGVILLNWDTPDREVHGYNLTIKQLMKNDTENMNQDNPEQNTTNNVTSYRHVKTHKIRYTAKSYLSKDGDILLGHTYVFELRATLADFRLSHAAEDTVIVSSDMVCPAAVDRPVICGLRIFPKILALQYVLHDVSAASDMLADTSCFSGVGMDYTGDVSRTRTGVRCRNWKSTEGNYTHLPKNLCRNPEGSNRTAPWCFTSNAVLDAEACNIPPCGRFKTTMKLRKNDTINNDEVTNYGVSGCVSFMTTHSKIDISTIFDYGIEGCGSKYTNITEDILQRSTLYDTIWFKYVLIHGSLASVVGCLWCYIIFKRRQMNIYRGEYMVDMKSESISRAFTLSSNKYKRRMSRAQLL